MRFILVALLVLAVTVNGSTFPEVNLKQHLQELFDHRYPTVNNQGTREKVKNYIIKQFNNYGFEVHVQNFNTSVNTDPRGIGSDVVTVDGTNIIGIKPAVTKQAGAVVVVGADYDSTGLTEPMFYNGAGVAALLEAAHLYAESTKESGRFVANFTTIFVAFDINTKHYQSSSGRPGGYQFVKEWLWPYIQRNPNYFGGAVILDSIMNVNYDNKSQTITTGFESIFPETYKRVSENGNKGDFLAMVSLPSDKDATDLKYQFSAAFNKDRRAKPYRLEDMSLKNGMMVDPMVQLFIESENVHFWTFRDDADKTVNLPAILITDTSKYRTDPTASCSTCRPADLITEDRIKFVNATVMATTRFLLDRQATLLPPPDSSAVSSLPSILMTVLMMSLVRLCM